MRLYVLALLAAACFGTAACSDQSVFELSSCSTFNPCDQGCCGPDSTCGFGPAFCGDGCQDTCDAEPECGEHAAPGRQTCPLHLCCSQQGFCGTTSEHCGEGCQQDCQIPPQPSCERPTTLMNTYSQVRTIGYFQSWANYHLLCLRHLDSMGRSLSLLTHLNYAFALIGDDHRIQALSPTDVKQWTEATERIHDNPSLKVSITVGGWAVRSSSFSAMAQSPASRSVFIKSVIGFMETYAFHGVDLYWEYPGVLEEGGSPEDEANYVHLVREMRQALGVEVEISVVIPSAFKYLRHFDLAEMSKYVNWFNLKSYDMHGPNGGDDGWRDLKVQTHSNLTEIDISLNMLWHAGVPPSQVVLGLGFYGRSFTLADPECTSPGCPIAGTGKLGYCLQTPGILDFTEITSAIDHRNLQPVFDETAAMKWISWDDQWVSYDDEETIKIKTDFAKKRCLSGMMVWSLDYDILYKPLIRNVVDSMSNLGLPWLEAKEVSERVRLTKTLQTIFREQHDATTNVILSDCGFYPRCPLGFKALTRATGFWSFMGKTGDSCPFLRNPSSAGYDNPQPSYRLLCIEEDTETEDCGWYGTPLFCSGLSFFHSEKEQELKENIMNVPGGCPAGTIHVASNNQPPFNAPVPDTCFPGTMSSFCCKTFRVNNKIRECASHDPGARILMGEVAGAMYPESSIRRIQRRQDRLAGKPDQDIEEWTAEKYGDYDSCGRKRGI